MDNEGGAYLPFTLALHFLCTSRVCRITGTATGAVPAGNRKEIYIERRNTERDAHPRVQNIGRRRLIRQGQRDHWQNAGLVAGCAANGRVATDVISMQTVPNGAVGDAD
ncbi:hypothetical protein [Pseudomonas bananamidigenes]|uniref:hypothetical protein n=1 Tax=Pseudomonas bananamidigenes TaxID=2843610 RepID=UPI0011465BC6|nr:hypothetical protein [Pseudomonas bananamidigenes]